MSLFGSGKAPTIADVMAEERAQGEARQEKLERQAREAEAEVVAGFDAHEALCREEEERQRAGFTFTCQCVGSFLVIHSTRLGNPDPPIQADSWWRWASAPREHEEALNLKMLGRIEVVSGHATDRQGTISYNYEAKPDLYAHTVPESRWHFGEWPKPDKHGHLMSSGLQTPRHRTPNAPRPSKDDEVKLHGLRASLYVPFGKGSEVFAQLVTATTRNEKNP